MLPSPFRISIGDMPFFRFLVQDETRRSPTIGAGSIRPAARSKNAADKVLARLTREFTRGASAPIWRSGEPILVIEEPYPIGLHQLLGASSKGSTFYDERERCADFRSRVRCSQ